MLCVYIYICCVYISIYVVCIYICCVYVYIYMLCVYIYVVRMCIYICCVYIYMLCVYIYIYVACIYTHKYIMRRLQYVCICADSSTAAQYHILCDTMGWLRLVGSLKLEVSFAEYRLFHRALLQKRLIILRSLLHVATPHGRTFDCIL